MPYPTEWNGSYYDGRTPVPRHVRVTVEPEGLTLLLAKGETRFLPYQELQLAQTPYTFRVTVVNSPVINALAAPGGYLIVFRGLLKDTSSPEELAEGDGVLRSPSSPNLTDPFLRPGCGKPGG